MGKHYDYVIHVSMRLKPKDTSPKSLDELKEFLQEEYQIIESHHVSDVLGFDPNELDEENADEDELTASLQLQVTFAESQMDADEPTDEALEELHDELTVYLECKYEVDCLELLDDALTSYLLSKWEDNE